MCSVWWVVVTREDSRVGQPGFRSGLFSYSSAVRPWECYLSSLCFSFLLGGWVLEDILTPAAHPASALPDIGADALWTVSLYDIWANWSYLVLNSECAMEGSELGWLLVSLWWSSSVCADCLLSARRPQTMFERCLKSTTTGVMKGEQPKEVILSYEKWVGFWKYKAARKWWINILTELLKMINQIRWFSPKSRAFSDSFAAVTSLKLSFAWDLIKSA